MIVGTDVPIMIVGTAVPARVVGTTARKMIWIVNLKTNHNRVSRVVAFYYP